MVEEAHNKTIPTTKLANIPKEYPKVNQKKKREREEARENGQNTAELSATGQHSRGATKR